MLYPYLTLDDETEIVHSEMMDDGRVKVWVEKPDDEDCLHSTVCWLPSYQWESISGFQEDEIARYQEVIESVAHIILRLSQEGGFGAAPSPGKAGMERQERPTQSRRASSMSCTTLSAPRWTSSGA